MRTKSCEDSDYMFVCFLVTLIFNRYIHSTCMDAVVFPSSIIYDTFQSLFVHVLQCILFLRAQYVLFISVCKNDFQVLLSFYQNPRKDCHFLSSNSCRVLIVLGFPVFQHFLPLKCCLIHGSDSAKESTLRVNLPCVILTFCSDNFILSLTGFHKIALLLLISRLVEQPKGRKWQKIGLAATK